MSFVGKNIDKALDRTRARTSTARAVLAQLARHANREGMAWPTQALIARRVGIKPRQVRNCLRELEALGEIETVEKGANRPTKYRVTVLSDEVVERQPIATPKDQMDRQSTTAPDNGWSGNTASLDRQPIAAEVIEENSARHIGVFQIVDDRDSAEKRTGNIHPFSPAIEPTAPSRDQAGMLGDRAREEIPGLNDFIAEARAKHAMTRRGG